MSCILGHSCLKRFYESIALNRKIILGQNFIFSFVAVPQVATEAEINCHAAILAVNPRLYVRSQRGHKMAVWTQMVKHDFGFNSNHWAKHLS